MVNPLREIWEVHSSEEWDALRRLRYVGQRIIEEDKARVDLFDDARNAQVIVYCLATLLPDLDFWPNRTH